MSVCGPKCSGCAFEHTGTIFIPHDGTGSNGVLLVGDSGWTWEAATHRGLGGSEVGTPFSGPSGWFMDGMFELMQRDHPGLRRDDFLIANSVWCKAPRLGMTDAPEKYPEAAAAIAHCRPYLDELIADKKPKAIVALGGAALHRLTGLHGIERHHAYVLDSPCKIPVIPAFHPSYILQGNRKLSGCWIYTIDKALKIAAGAMPVFREPRLLLDPGLEKAQGYFFEGALDWVACDIETAESPDLGEDELSGVSWKITRISFSACDGTAISMPFAPPYLDLIKRVLRNSKRLIFWNKAFDVPRLEAAFGFRLDEARIYDAMWAWHFLQSDLPKRLGFVVPLLLNVRPWKHLSSALPAYYNALDSCYTWQAMMEIRALLEREGRWSDFENQCTDLMPVLVGMTDAGILIDTEAQTKLIDERLTKERDDLYAKIQEGVPTDVKPIKVYKKAPKKIPEFASFDAESHVLRLPFNPSSSAQRKRLFSSLGISIPRSREGGETIEKKHLHRYARRFPVLKLIEDYGERQKIITSYNWQLQPDGRVHPIFGFNPSTWRKNASDPNIMTIPKRSDLAAAFRGMFIAAPGHVLIEIDSSAIEAVLVGYFAHSGRYIALAKRGVHKWLAEKLAGRPVSKEEPLYDKVKRIVHLSNYLGSPARIAEEYPDDFANKREAAKLQDFYFEQPEGQDVRAWQSETLALANYQHYLETPFGQRHYFYDVLQKYGKLGTDAKRSIAFMPQATASALQTLYIHRLPERWRVYLPNGLYHIPFMRAIIHDSIVAEVPEHSAKEFAADLYGAMTSPVDKLGGLSIGAEAKMGKDLGHMTKIWELYR